MSPKTEHNDPYMRTSNTNSKCHNLRLAIWNSEEKTFLGRTAKRWALLLVFYSMFYLVLAALFTVCMYTVLKILPEDRPMYTLSESLIGTNPGMGFRPQFVDEASLIAYNAQNETQVAKYVNQLDQWLQEYSNSSYPGAASRVHCDSFTPKHKTQACAVDISGFGPCSSGNQYGYKSMQPCIFIKLNRIFDWVPEYYTTPEESMPADLQEYIKSASETKQIWISCEGEAPADREGLNYNLALGKNITYYPSRGIPWYYYPYRNQLGYVNPIIAVQFNNLQLAQIINIRCRAWAKNIVFSPSLKELFGSTHIEIRVDNDPIASPTT